MKTTILICLILLAILGCERSEQRGKFVVSTNERVALNGQNGALFILRGRKLDERNKEMSLLGVIVVDPDKIASFGGSETSHGHLTSTIELAKTLGSEQNILCSWNRENDTVDIASKSFDRSIGEIFLVVLRQEENPTIEQIKSENSSFSSNDVLDLVRRKHPNRLSGASVAGAE